MQKTVNIIVVSLLSEAVPAASASHWGEPSAVEGDVENSVAVCHTYLSFVPSQDS